MTDNVIPLRFNVQQVGKHVKGSKKRFTWQVSLNSKQHIIVLDFSFISGKVKVAVDRKILLENQLPTNTSFQYPFTLDGNALNVIQQGENFQLRINNKVFSHLYNQMKTNKQFKKYEDQVRDFNVNQNQFQAKKITLNIGGSTTGMKKKPKAQSTFQEHNWNAFGQNQIGGFPSYFENQSVASTTTSSKIQQKKQTKKMDNLLDITQSQKPSKQANSNILDFQSQLQKPASYNNASIPNQSQLDFNTMQNMFSTLNMGNNNNLYQNKPSVVIDSNQVDFFSSTQEPLNNQTVNKPNNNTQDLFSLIETTNNKPSVTNMNMTPSNMNNNQNNMHTMFNTMNNPNQNNFGFGTGLNMNQASNFATMTSTMNQQQNNKPFSLQGLNFNSSNINQNNINASNIPQTHQLTTGFETNNFNAMQGLFATNIMPTTTNNNNISLNQNNFSTGLQMKSTQQINQITLDVKPSSMQESPMLTNMNMNDFNTLPNLFQTNNLGMMPMQQTISQQTKLKATDNFGLSMNTGNIPSTNIQITNNGFESNFNTGTVSPNMIGMNTYSGGNFGLDFNNNNSNQGFNMNMNQFSTSVNMNKNNISKPLQKSITKPNQDLI